MTGLACSRHSCTARFCTSGTWSSGSSTPRSPRATISAVEGVDDRLERARPPPASRSWRGPGRRTPSSSMISCTSLMSLGRPHERQGDHVDTEPQREPQVVDVLVGQCRDAHRDVRQRDALVVGDRATLDHQALDVVAVDAGDLDGDLAVVDEQPVAGLHLLRQLGVGAGDPVLRTEDLVAGDDHGVAGAPLDLRVGEPAEADLRALQVGEDADGPSGGLGGLPHQAVRALVVGVAAVAEVQPGDVHTGVDEPPDAVRRLRQPDRVCRRFLRDASHSRG